MVVFPQQPQRRRGSSQGTFSISIGGMSHTCAQPSPASAASPSRSPQLDHAAGGRAAPPGRGTRSGKAQTRDAPGCPPGVRSFERNRCERTIFRLAYAAIESFDSAVALLKPLVVNLLFGDLLPLASHRSIVSEHQAGEWPMRSFRGG